MLQKREYSRSEVFLLQFLANFFPFVYFFEGEEIARFLDRKCSFYVELFEGCLSLQCRWKCSVNSISDISAKMQHFFYYLLNLFQQRGSLCFTMHSLRVEIKFPDFKNLENRDNYLETFYQLMEHWTS